MRDFSHDKRREYYRCGECALVFVSAEARLTAALEKAEYDLHRNDPADAGYRRFLNRLCEPLAERLEPASDGLDFGSGPGPTLSVMLEACGHRVDLYDPFYAPDTAVFRRRYQFITATEVVEHLYSPGEELARLWGLLEAGGYLGIMTKLVIDADRFANWHYKNDPTHVCFFSAGTWQWWAQHYGAELELLAADVILLRKPPA